MNLLEIRSQFLDDHATLRGKVSVLRSLALSVLRGDEELASALRRKGQDLQDLLQRHISWEERNLLPVIERVHPTGAVTAARLLKEHTAQRNRLTESLTLLESPGSQPRQLAKMIMELISWIERDMATEEAAVLAVMKLGAEVGLGADEIRSGARRD